MKNLKRSFSLVCDAPSRRTSAELLKDGLTRHQAGQWIEAAEIYRQILVSEPHLPNALHLYGMVLLQLGDLPKAVQILHRATDADPGHVESRFNLGNAYLRSGDISNAQRWFERTLEGNPDHLSAQFNLGHCLGVAGHHLESIQRFVEVANVAPNFPAVWINLGVHLTAIERLEEAANAFAEATRRQPELPQGWHNLGCVLGLLDRNEEAIAALCEAIKRAPNDVDALLNLSRALLKANSLDVVEVARQATQLSPHRVDCWVALADAYLATGSSEPAKTAYDHALTLDPTCTRESNNYGLALFQEGLLDETIAFFEDALSRRPGDSDGWADLGIARLHAADLEGAEADLRRSVALNPENEFVHSNLLVTLCYSPQPTNQMLFEESKQWAAIHAPVGQEFPPVHTSSGEKLRIGYVSADFHAHPAGYLYEAMFPHHDRSRFEIVAYMTSPFRDEVTARIEQSVDEWVPCDHLKGKELAEQIRGDKIDILIDLLGHTPKHRLKSFGYHPAPVQATWLGYFGTTGMPQMDFILADRYMLPPDQEPFYSERPARMPGCLYVFQPPKLAIRVNDLPAIQNGFVTFGCFNNPSKISEGVVALWCEVLRTMPDSRLILNRWSFKSEQVLERFKGYFEKGGVDVNRIEFRATRGREPYFRSYHDVDIMLDSFPFGGGTTTSEALWMGVPVMTLSSDRFVGRMTESLLHTVGLAELLPTDAADFVTKTVTLANDLPRLSALRQGLRAQVEGSPLCDLPSYTRDLEATFEWMWANKG